MKRYKLIKDFPTNVHKLGTIMTFGKGWNSTENWINDNKELAKEFWEEIIDDGYTINKYLEVDSNNYFIRDHTRVDAFHISFNKLIILSAFEISEDINNYKIIEIIRLSDGKIFTINDKVDSTISDLGRATDLTKFKIIDNELMFGLRDLGYYPLKTIFFPKTPLFTTEDGIDIFKNDICWYVNESNQLCGGLHQNRKGAKHDFYVWFSTRGLAEEYIVNNKQIYSKKDMLNFATAAIAYKSIYSKSAISNCFDTWKLKK